MDSQMTTVNPHWPDRRLFVYCLSLALVVPALTALPNLALKEGSLMGVDMQLLLHLMLHLVSLCLSLLLVIVSSTAFLRNRRSRLLYVTAAFGGILMREAVSLQSVALGYGNLTLPGGHLEIGHLMDSVILAFFAIGTLKG